MSEGQRFDDHTHQTMMEYIQELEHPPRPQPAPRRKIPAPSSTPRIQADEWVEVTRKGKGKAKTFAQAVAAATSPPVTGPLLSLYA